MLDRPISKLDKVETGTLERLESSCKVIFNTCRLKNAHMEDNSKLKRRCLSMLYFFIISPKIKRAKRPFFYKSNQVTEYASLLYLVEWY